MSSRRAPSAGRSSTALFAALALSCSREAAPGPDVAAPEQGVHAERQESSGRATSPTSASSATSPIAPSTSAPALPAAPLFLLTELAPTQGELTPLLVMQFERARGKGLVEVVEFYADWCPPCRTFSASLDSPSMKDALAGALLVKLNLDDWHDKLKGTGFDVHSIPRFYVIGANGRPTGATLDGDKWGKPTIAVMASSIRKLLGRE
jgi:thiol-disulfide isomerase/thioredoxin